MKHYIFLSYITGSGGVQCYVAAKAKFLEEQGWHVVVISDNSPYTRERCVIPFLNRFISNGSVLLKKHAYTLPRFLVKNVLDNLLRIVGLTYADDTIIVESWNSQTAVWGELLASRLHARHIFWTANEIYRGGSCGYEKKMEFYMFKMDRGEIFTNVQGANHLFEGFRIYKEGDFKETIITEDPIQDIACPQLELLKKKDYNICYIGRSLKPYVPSIYKGVEEFAHKHNDKTIQFIVVGEVLGDRKDYLPKNSSNLKVVEMGDLFPLPRILFNTVDVVIAGSGSARHSADEGSLVIVADAESDMTHGLLGYDTNESIYSDENNKGLNITYAEALDRALVQQTWKKQTNKWKKSPGVAECTKVQFDIINESNPTLEYYNDEKLLKGKIDYRQLLTISYEFIKIWILRVIDYFKNRKS